MAQQRLKNAQILKLMLDINNKYAEEHPDEYELLKPTTKEYLTHILAEGEKHGNDAQITNLLFNKGLKSTMRK